MKGRSLARLELSSKQITAKAWQSWHWDRYIAIPCDLERTPKITVVHQEISSNDNNRIEVEILKRDSFFEAPIPGEGKYSLIDKNTLKSTIGTGHPQSWDRFRKTGTQKPSHRLDHPLQSPAACFGP